MRWAAGGRGQRWFVVLVAFAVWQAAPSRALAQRWGDAPPSTITLDRVDETTRLGVQVGFDKLDAVKLSDGFAMRYELYGQTLLSNKTVGLYGALAAAHLFNFESSGAEYTALSNLDVGAFFLPTHRSDLVFRVGLVLPTASETTEREETNGFTRYERLTDAVLLDANYTFLRFSVSTVQESGRAFFRGDLGFDLAIDKPGGAGTPSVFGRGNAAAGVRLNGVDLALELVNFGALDGTVPGGITSRFFHTLAVGLRTRGADQFHLGTVFPLDDSTRGKIWIVSLGYQHATN
jgi:hypothetical protein